MQFLVPALDQQDTALTGRLIASDYSVIEGTTVTLTFMDESLTGIVTASDYDVIESTIVTLGYVMTSYQWIDENDDDIPGATEATYDWEASLTEDPPRVRVTNTAGKTRIFTVDQPIVVSPGLPEAITEYWQAGVGLLKSGDVPATEGDIVTKWIGQKLGTVLTATSSLVAKSINGVLVPVAITDGASWSLPGGFATGNSRNLSVYCHVGVAGLNGEGSYFGLGGSRVAELIHYQRIDTISYDGATTTYHAITGKVSPCTVGIRSSGSALKPFVNSNEKSIAAWANNTLTSGKFGSLHDGSITLVARWYGIAIGPLLTDLEHASTLSYWQLIKASPSDTAPTLNIAAYGDSNTEGTNSSGQSWAHLLADEGYRVFHVGNSAGYFGVSGNPANKAANITQLALEKVAGAGKNVIVIAFTNDFDQGVGAGAAHMARVKTFGQARQAQGWLVAVCKMPNRAAPVINVTQYNTEVAAFNSLINSDPWMDFAPDLTVINGTGLQSDGIHWTAAAQVIIADTVNTAIA